MTFYVTTAIPYVNAPPHLRHALELVQADVRARHRRSRGERVRFLTGTDGTKLAKSAGNAVDPVALAGWYGVEAVRWWLLSLSLTFSSAPPPLVDGVAS